MKSYVVKLLTKLNRKLCLVEPCLTLFGLLIRGMAFKSRLRRSRGNGHIPPSILRHSICSWRRSRRSCLHRRTSLPPHHTSLPPHRTNHLLHRTNHLLRHTNHPLLHTSLRPLLQTSHRL